MSLSPPRPVMPSLNALRAFEAAARLGSMVLAASELSVTPGAVAQHVKSLEAWAGQKLFHRRAQGIELTQLGSSVLADFTGAFDQLGEAVQKLRAEAAPQEIRIAALPAIAQLWLSPRLPELRVSMPEVTVSIAALEQPPNLSREPFDLSIFLEPHPVGVGGIRVCDDVILPVCSHSVASRLKRITDLAGAVFLHDTRWEKDWRIWLDEALPDRKFDTTGPQFSLYSLAVEEAKNGAGVLIGHEFLLQEQLKNGELVAPFSRAVEPDQSLVIRAARPVSSGSALHRVIRHLRGDTSDG